MNIWKQIKPKYINMTMIECIWIILFCIYLLFNPFPKYLFHIIVLYGSGLMVMTFIGRKMMNTRQGDMK